MWREDNLTGHWGPKVARAEGPHRGKWLSGSLSLLLSTLYDRKEFHAVIAVTTACPGLYVHTGGQAAGGAHPIQERRVAQRRPRCPCVDLECRFARQIREASRSALLEVPPGELNALAATGASVARVHRRRPA